MGIKCFPSVVIPRSRSLQNVLFAFILLNLAIVLTIMMVYLHQTEVNMSLSNQLLIKQVNGSELQQRTIRRRWHQADAGDSLRGCTERMTLIYINDNPPLHRDVPTFACVLKSDEKMVTGRLEVIEKNLAEWSRDCQDVVVVASSPNDTIVSLARKYKNVQIHYHGLKKYSSAKVLLGHFMHYLIVSPINVKFIMKNLHAYLADLNFSSNLYIGKILCDPRRGVWYNTERAGYVLSFPAFVMLRSMYFGEECDVFGTAEDAQIGHCLFKLGIEPYNTIDYQKRGKINDVQSGQTLTGNYNRWYGTYNYTCCSNEPISVFLG